MLYKSDINIIKNTAQVGRCFVRFCLYVRKLYISNIEISIENSVCIMRLDYIILNVYML